MGNCQGCRWWQQQDIEPEYQAADDVALTREPESWGLCGLAMSLNEQPSRPETKAFAAQGDYESEDKPAALVTAPDFGCLQFEAKD